MKRILVFLLALAALQLNAQDLPHFKRVVAELSSAKYQGRGYARGVPCIFLENGEGSAFQHYHTPADNIKTVRWDSYEPVFRLVTGFIDL